MGWLRLEDGSVGIVRYTPKIVRFPASRQELSGQSFAKATVNCSKEQLDFLLLLKGKKDGNTLGTIDCGQRSHI